MPSIIYKVPFIGASNDDRRYAQKGPTCWYYAGKMLMKYHDVIHKKYDAIYQSYKALSQVRKLMTSLGMEERKTAMIGRDYRVDKLVELLNKQSVMTAKHLASLVNADAKHSKALQQAVAGKDSQAAGNASRDLGTLLGKMADMKKKQAALQEAIRILGKAAGRHISHNALLDFFLGSTLFVPVPPLGGTWNKTVTELYHVLNHFGPVWAAGDLTATAYTDTKGESDYQVTAIGGQQYGHAVVVVGVNTELKTVYYQDPNASDRVCSINADLFLSKLALVTFAQQPTLYATVRCPSTAPNGGDHCAHVHAQKNQYKDRLRADDFDVDWGAYQSALDAKSPAHTAAANTSSTAAANTSNAAAGNSTAAALPSPGTPAVPSTTAPPRTTPHS